MRPAATARPTTGSGAVPVDPLGQPQRVESVLLEGIDHPGKDRRHVRAPTDRSIPGAQPVADANLHARQATTQKGGAGAAMPRLPLFLLLPGSGGQGVSRSRRRRRWPDGTSSRSRTASGTSSRSGPLRAGRMTSVSPARWAASTFCLTPTDRQHLALQGDLAGHADLRAHRATGQQADQRGGHGHPGRRTVLGHGTGRHVDVEALRSKARRSRPSALGVRAHVRQGDLRRLLHDVAELAGEGQTRPRPAWRSPRRTARRRRYR